MPDMCICGHYNAVHGSHGQRRCGACIDCGVPAQNDPPDGQVHTFIPCDCPGFEPDNEEVSP